MKFRNPYFDQVEKIQLIERWIILHSFLYYELNESISSDQNFDANVKQFEYLVKKYPESFEHTRYHEYFKNSERSFFDLWKKIESGRDVELIQCVKKDAEFLINKVKSN